MKFFVTFLFSTSLLFSSMKVYVANKSDINSITKQELKNLYLKKTKLLNNKEVVVLDNIDEYEKFYTDIIQKTSGQIHAYWMKQIFLGKKIPPKKIKYSQIINTINQNHSAIVYSEQALDAKVIYEDK